MLNSQSDSTIPAVERKRDVNFDPRDTANIANHEKEKYCWLQIIEIIRQF